MRLGQMCLLGAASALTLPILSCSSDSDSSPATIDQTIAASTVENYADMLYNNYLDVLEMTQELHDAIDALVAGPAANTLQDAKDAWLAVRPFYIQTEMGRFYDGPIDRAADGVEGFLNAWPLDEVYIDYVTGDAAAGIINDAATYPVIDESVLRDANESGGEANISIGWHAIEFLLWGQDGTLGVGGGSRSHLDFLDAGGTAPSGNEDRRRTYIAVCADLLVEDMQFLVDEWDPDGTNNFRDTFLAQTPNDALTNIMTGMGSLGFGELRGERILVPFQTKDKEDEHSCFSDTTHLDHLNDMIGIQNAWLGRYSSSDGLKNVNGLGIEDVAQDFNATLATTVDNAINDAISALQSIPEPFETAIAGVDTDPGRVAVQDALDALNTFNDAFSDLASAMGLTVTTALQE